MEDATWVGHQGDGRTAVVDPAGGGREVEGARTISTVILAHRVFPRKKLCPVEGRRIESISRRIYNG